MSTPEDNKAPQPKTSGRQDHEDGAPDMEGQEVIPEVVEIKMDFVKDAVRLGSRGCRNWK